MISFESRDRDEIPMPPTDTIRLQQDNFLVKRGGKGVENKMKKHVRKGEEQRQQKRDATWNTRRV